MDRLIARSSTADLLAGDGRSPALDGTPTSPGEEAEAATVDALTTDIRRTVAADPGAFRTATQQAFGGKADAGSLNALAVGAARGELPLPANVRFVDAGTLGPGALGAYEPGGGGTIYFDRSLLGDPVALRATYAEELGHHLDAVLGGPDAAGDEGAIFARTLLEGPVAPDELRSLKAEDDSGFIRIDGRQLRVEFRDDGPENGGVSSGGSSGSSSSGSSGGTTTGRRDGPENGGVTDGVSPGGGGSGLNVVGRDDGRRDERIGAGTADVLTLGGLGMGVLRGLSAAAARAIAPVAALLSILGLEGSSTEPRGADGVEARGPNPPRLDPESREKVDDALGDREIVNEEVTGNGTVVDAVPGGKQADADADFDDMGLTDVRTYETARGEVRTGRLPDGTTVAVRPSADGRPTIEITDRSTGGSRPPKREIRYGDKQS